MIDSLAHKSVNLKLFLKNMFQLKWSGFLVWTRANFTNNVIFRN